MSRNKAAAKVTSAIKATLAIQKPKGLFHGSFTPDGGKAPGYTGVILQNLQSGIGFFLNGDQAGSMMLQK